MKTVLAGLIVDLWREVSWPVRIWFFVVTPLVVVTSIVVLAMDMIGAFS